MNIPIITKLLHRRPRRPHAARKVFGVTVDYGDDQGYTPPTGWGWDMREPTPPVPSHRAPGGDPATLPMKTWDATGHPEIHEELRPTAVIPKVVPEGPEAAFIELAYNDVDAFCTAARVLRGTRDINTVLAGLTAYVASHRDARVYA